MSGAGSIPVVMGSPIISAGLMGGSSMGLPMPIMVSGAMMGGPIMGGPGRGVLGMGSGRGRGRAWPG